MEEKKKGDRISQIFMRVEWSQFVLPSMTTHDQVQSKTFNKWLNLFWSKSSLAWSTSYGWDLDLVEI